MILALFLTSFLASGPAIRQGQDAASEPFPSVDSASVGIPAGALEALASSVQGLVERDEIVGAELLVIRGSRSVLHRCFGWKDRDEQIAMQPDTIFCVRSMTKAVVGTAVQMLLEDEEIAREDPVALHLPAFDTESCRVITVEQLLHHTSGLSLSSLLGSDLSSIASLQDVAALGAASGPQFPPGERWSYSDDGADALGALVERVSGRPLEEFLRESLFEPLGMSDTLTFVAEGHEKRARIASNYAGTKGSWNRYWSPEDASLFPIFLASQGLYSTPRDYARFLAMWMDNGRFGGTRLLRIRTARAALEPAVDSTLPTGFRDARVRWGDMWMLWVEGTDEEEKLLAFGHGGSDGTFSYAFPALDLMVFYFTQSRNNRTFVQFETALEEHLLDPLRGRSKVPPAAYTEAELELISGIYWEIDDDEPMAVLRRGEGLAIEFPGKAILGLAPKSERDRFDLELVPGRWIEIERDETGHPVALVGHQGENAERHPRLIPAADLPSGEDVLALREEAIDHQAVRALSPLRIAGRFEMPVQKDRGSFTSLCAGFDRCRTELVGEKLSMTILFDHDRAWMQTGDSTTEQDAASAFRMHFDHPLFAVSDWRPLFRELAVLARIERDGRSLLVLRGLPHHGNARYLYVDALDGRLVEEDRIEPDWGMGDIGTRVLYGDWRAVEGTELPHEIFSRYASRLLGTFEVRHDTIEPHASIDESSFRPASGK